jgi:hypothetical protein
MSNVVAFPKRKISPRDTWPKWKEELFGQWHDSERWVVAAKGARWLNVPRYIVSIYPVTVEGDDGEDEGWWTYSIHGAPEPDEAWFDPAEAEHAAWLALTDMIERRARRRK